MTLHDRIMRMDVGTLSGDNSFHEGVTAAKFKAAMVAQDADELMAEMGNALASIDPDDLPRRIKGLVALAINHYNTYKERNNEQ